MAFFKGWFSKKQEEDYETILSNLANDVQNAQVKLSEIRLRERRSTFFVTAYTLAAWVAYVSLWYMNMLPSLPHTGERRTVRDVKVDRTVKGLPVVVGPIIILFIRRIVQLWYQRKGNAEEKSLQQLMKLRREKVEEIKKKTNYYTTRDLLQKYDETAPAETPLRRRNPGVQGPPGGVPQTPQFATPQQPQLRPIPNSQTPAKPLDPRLTALSPPFPVQPPRKQWYDSIMDAIVGDDESSFSSPSSRYALICAKCFSHNGLVKESMWEDAQYVCPKCGHFNASARAKKQKARGSLSPSTPAGISRMGSSSPPSTTSTPSKALPESGGDGGPDLPTVDSDVQMEVDH